MGRRHASLIPFANKWFIRADGERDRPKPSAVSQTEKLPLNTQILNQNPHHLTLYLNLQVHTES